MRRSSLRMSAASGVLCVSLAAWVEVLLGVPAPALAAGTTGAEVRVVIESPTPGQVVRGKFDMAPLSGLALTGDRPADFDVVLVVDVSRSTEHCTLSDIDGDGVTGRREPGLVLGFGEVPCSDPDDSILAAEVRAGHALLSNLDSQRIRVGLVSFSGREDPTGASSSPSSVVDAQLDMPLTADLEAVAQALDALLERGPHGHTNIAHGLRLATRELAGGEQRISAPRPGAKRVALLLTDGKPSLPQIPGSEQDPGDVLAATSAAREAAAAGVRVNVYGVGPGAVTEPRAAIEIAKATRGAFHAVRQPAELVALFSGVTFANVDSVVAVNLTSGEVAGPHDIHLRPDGSFSGFVPVVPGSNRVRVAAFSSDGVRGTAEITIDYLHQDLSTAETQAELDRIRQRTRAIELEVERRRQDALRERERERALEIEIEQPVGEETAP